MEDLISQMDISKICARKTKEKTGRVTPHSKVTAYAVACS